MAEPTIAAGIARALLQFAASRGASVTTLAILSGIDAAALEDPDGRLPMSTYVRLMRAAKRLSGDPALALGFGEAFELADFSVVGTVTAPVGAIADGLVPLNRYARLAVEAEPADAERFRLERVGSQIWLVDRRPDPNRFPELTESTFARIASTSRRAGIALVREVHVTHPAPDHANDYERVFGVPVTFDGAWNALRLDADLLDRGLASPADYAHSVITRHADALLQRLASEKTCRGGLEKVLFEILPQGHVTVEAAARKLKTSRHTLYRKLAAEGTTYEEVLLELRRRLALSYLQEGRMPVAEAAHRLGFSDRASFAKAFKRWTGLTPGEARNE